MNWLSPPPSPYKQTKPARKTRRKVKRLKRDSSRQLYLDFGQRNFGPTRCKQCGMVYSNGQSEDEQHHKKFHKRFVEGAQFAGWKYERVVGWHDEGRIVMVLPTDSRQHLKKVDEILNLVNHELGIEHDQLYNDASKVFIFVSTQKKVIGCVVADQIEKAYEMIPTLSTAVVCHSSKPHVANIGIRKLWVCNTHRRKGIATKMLDCIRSNFIFGMVVPRELVAFSDPTLDGKEFAKNYMKDRLLIY